MAGIFARIASGEIPSYKVYEDDRFFAFLDINPLAKGHTLVIPKKEVDYLFDLDENTYKDLWLCAMSIAKAIKQVVPCIKVGVAVIGLEVPHTHIHLVPMNTMDDINFSRAKLTFAAEEMQQLATDIASKIT